MSDPALELQDAVKTVLMADAGVRTAFAPAKVTVYDLPPTNAAFPYLTLADMDVLPAEYECLDAADTVVHVHVWTRTSPPATRQAKMIAASVVAAMAAALDLGLLALASFRVVDILPLGTLSPPEFDGQTTHRIARFQVSTDPL